MDVIHFNMAFLISNTHWISRVFKGPKNSQLCVLKALMSKKEVRQNRQKTVKVSVGTWIWDVNILVYRFGCTFWIWSNLDLLGTRF